MSKYEGKDRERCRICGQEIQLGEDVEWAKHKGTTYYVHTDCLQKEGATKR